MLRTLVALFVGCSIALPAAAQGPPCGQNNQPPEPDCRDFFEIAVDSACNWHVENADLAPDFYDPEGHDLVCHASPDEGMGLDVRPLNVWCADGCGGDGGARCEPLVVPRDVDGPVVTVGRPQFAIQAGDGWGDWTTVRTACDMSWTDNCTPSAAVQHGIVDITSSDPHEIVGGEPGHFLSDGIVTDWTRFVVNRDLGLTVPRTYTLRYALLDAYDQFSYVDCEISLLDGPVCNGDPNDGTCISCCTPHGSAQCDDPQTVACVCARDAYCCDKQWDAMCVNAVEQLGCGTCDGCSNGVCGTPGFPVPVVNAGFEDGTADTVEFWFGKDGANADPSVYIWDTEQVHSGARSLKIRRTNTGSAYWHTAEHEWVLVPVVGGAPYRFSVWVRVENATEPPELRAQIYNLDENGHIVKLDSGLHIARFEGDLQALSDSGEWVQISAEILVPGNVDYLRMFLYQTVDNEFEAPQTLWFDDLVVEDQIDAMAEKVLGGILDQPLPDNPEAAALVEQAQAIRTNLQSGHYGAVDQRAPLEATSLGPCSSTPGRTGPSAPCVSRTGVMASRTTTSWRAPPRRSLAPATTRTRTTPRDISPIFWVFRPTSTGSASPTFAICGAISLG